MALSFDRETPVLLPERKEYSGKQSWILWPVLQYRVIAPVVHEQLLNAFQRAMLGLAQAGQRDISRIAELLGLDPEAAELVRSDLRQLNYLDQYGALTQIGRTALADGFLDPTHTIVTYVFQDVFTGTLFPGSMSRLQYGSVQDARARFRTVEFGTAGEPNNKTCLEVVPSHLTPGDPPSGEEIVEAVARGEAARQRARRQRRWAMSPPQRIVRRVSVVLDGEPAFLPIALLRIREKPELGKAAGWRAFDPLTGQESTFLRRLIALRSGHYPPLRKQLERLLDRSMAVLYADLDSTEIALRRQVSDRLAAQFQHRLGDHDEVAELLTLVEIKFGLACRDATDDRLQSVVVHAWQLHEVILREVVSTHRVVNPFGRPPDAAKPLGQQLGEACRRLGLPYSNHRLVSYVEKKDVSKAFKRPRDVTRPALLAAAVISADRGGDDHPVRRLAAQRRTLLQDLNNLSSDRNIGAHGAPEKINMEFAELAWRLAHETTAVYLGLPVPATDRKPTDLASAEELTGHGEEGSHTRAGQKG